MLLLFQTHMHYHLPQYHYQHRHDNVMVIALPLVRYGLNQTQKRFKRAIFIRTRHDMRIFGIIPFSKLQNASSRFCSVLFCCCCCSFLFLFFVCLFVCLFLSRTDVDMKQLDNKRDLWGALTSPSLAE